VLGFAETPEAVIVVRTHNATLAPAAIDPVFVTAALSVPVAGDVSVAAVVQLAAVPISTATAERRVVDAEVAVMLVE
jgi:hypothetical protein